MYGGVGQKMRHFVDFKGALKLIEQSELWQERNTIRTHMSDTALQAGT